MSITGLFIVVASHSASDAHRRGSFKKCYEHLVDNGFSVKRPVRARAIAEEPAQPEVVVVKPVAVKAGEQFTVSLESNLATGYRWQLAKLLDEKVVTLVDSKYERTGQKGLVGAGGSGALDVQSDHRRQYEHRDEVCPVMGERCLAGASGDARGRSEVITL